MKDQELEAFKTTKEGKYIKSYGTLLVVFGAIMLAATLFYLINLFRLSSEYESGLSSLGIFVLFYYMALMALSIYYLYCGIEIRKFSFSPQKTKTISIIILISIFAIYILSNLLQQQIEPGATLGLGILQVFVLIDVTGYLRKYHKAYSSIYETEKKKIHHITPSSRAKLSNQKTETKSKPKPAEEYEDDMI